MALTGEIQAPMELDFRPTNPAIFLAGGITDCPNWQQEMIGKLTEVPVILLNPRQDNFDIGIKDAAKKQIAWEHHHLRKAAAISFWFPCETLCPIVLYELGAWSMTEKPIFVGVHPDYKRRQDVEIQTALARPKVQVVYDLDSLCRKVAEWRVAC